MLLYVISPFDVLTTLQASCESVMLFVNVAKEEMAVWKRLTKNAPNYRPKESLHRMNTTHFIACMLIFIVD